MVEPTTWTCPTCGRRVPNRASECHCGMQKATAQAMVDPLDQPPPREQIRIRTPRVTMRSLPKEVRVLLGALAVVLLLGIVWLVWPRKPERALPLLGTLDRIPPPPSPSAKPTPPPKPKPTPRAPGATILGTPLPAPPSR